MRLKTPHGNEIEYQGIGHEGGPLPAFFYFALWMAYRYGLDRPRTDFCRRTLPRRMGRHSCGSFRDSNQNGFRFCSQVLTSLDALEELASPEHSIRAKIHAEALNLTHLVDRLTHLHHLRFYIGNRDERVNTDAAYAFIRKLADKGHEVRARHLHVELRITPTLGYKGHGTSLQTFVEGTLWLKEQLLR